MLIGPGMTLSPGTTVSKPLPPLSYSLTSVESNINEGSSLTFNVSTTAVPDGTTLYWGIGIGGTNMSFGRLSSTIGSVTISSGAASFSITVSADELTSPDQQYFTVRLYKDAPGGSGGTEVDQISINVNDTSQTPPAHGSAVFNQPENDYMSLPALPDWNLGTTWTIEFWIYMNYGSNDNTHIQGGIWGLLNQDGWGATNSINIGLASGYLQVAGINSSAQYRAFIEPTPQQWIHVAVVNNAGTQSVFYNGVQQVQVNGDYGNGNYSNSTSPLYIGSLNSGNSFDGKLTNLRITDTAVYTANFNPPTVLPTKITNHTRLLWTPTDQALATDTSDDPHTITNNGVTYSSSYPSANTTPGSAVFNGTSYMIVGTPGSTPWNLGTTWTVEWWSKATTATVYHGAGLWTVMSAGVGNNLFDIYYQDNLLHAGNGVEICTEPPAGVWTHVAMVNSNGSLKVYYNGIAQTVNAYNYNLTNSSAALYIGTRGPNLFQNFVGKLASIRITDTEVYTGDFVPTQTPVESLDDRAHDKLLYIPTVDTIYGVDTGSLALPLRSSGIKYSSDYPPVIHRYTARQWLNGYSGGANSNVFVLLADYPDIVSVPSGATMTWTGHNTTVSINSPYSYSGSATRQIQFPGDEGLLAAGETITFTWYT